MLKRADSFRDIGDRRFKYQHLRIEKINIQNCIFRHLEYEQVYMQLCKVADTPFYIQDDEICNFLCWFFCYLLFNESWLSNGMFVHINTYLISLGFSPISRFDMDKI